MKQFCLLILVLLLHVLSGQAQNVGIGTTTPNANALLDLQANNKGVLFPRLTSAQRNAIVNPPDGLHLFNTDERCLNFYDSLFQVWNCYCDNDTCHLVTIRIVPGCSINFKTTYAASHVGTTKFVLLINAGDTISGCGTAAFDFSTVTTSTAVKIINRGVIVGNGGSGGSGATGNTGSCIRNAGPGSIGGVAIQSGSLVTLTIYNYGLIAGGGGGGGGGGSTGADVYGGGGGAGSGLYAATGGNGGGTTFSGPFGSCGTINRIAQDGTSATINTVGTGGSGANGGGNGGMGGLLGQPGQSGTGNNAGAAGLPGKAVNGVVGNTVIINLQGGQVIGVVD